MTFKENLLPEQPISRSSQNIKKNSYKGEAGFSVLALIAAILLLGSIGYIMSSLMSRHQETVPLSLDTARAFYIAQGGVTYVGKYLKVSGGTDWTTTSVPPNQPINLGNGNFTVAFAPVDADNLTATIVGNSGAAHRRVVVTFHKTSGSALAVRSLGEIYMGNNAALDCQPSDTTNPVCTNVNLGSCPCTRANVASSDIPTFSIPSPTPPQLPGGCTINSNRTIPPGIYYCPSGVSVSNNRLVTLTGAVTIFTTTFDLNNNVRFNQTGPAADLLIMAQGNISIANNAVMMGALYSPGYNITLGNNTAFTGTIAGGNSAHTNTISLNNIGNFDVNAGSNSAYYNLVGGGAGSNISISNWQE